MKYTAATLAALVAGANGAPSPSVNEKPNAAVAARAAAVTLDATTNVWTTYSLHANSFYRSEIKAATANLSSTDAATALRVGDIGTFLWLDSIANIARLEPALSDVGDSEIFGAVIYDLPGRDCNALASNGELALGQLDQYKSEYIDPIAAIISNNSNIPFALVIEPDSLPNLVTNSDNPLCSSAVSDYEGGIAYALTTLNLPNVVMYIDAGHGGWLGWDANLQPGAEELAKVYKAANSPSQVRGFSTNVAGWNQWDMVPGEFADDPDGQYNKAQNEKLYVEMFGAALETAGMPNHAITDTSRSGNPGGRLAWGDWCNVVEAGFGLRPSSDTGETLADAFVWVKPGGESDGTSDTSSPHFDAFCGQSDAFQPSPESGEWNQAYFEVLIANANPAI